MLSSGFFKLLCLEFLYWLKFCWLLLPLRGTFVSEFFLLMASVAVTISAVVVIVVVGVNDVRFRLLDDEFVEDTPDDVFNE